MPFLFVGRIPQRVLGQDPPALFARTPSYGSRCPSFNVVFKFDKKYKLVIPYSVRISSFLSLQTPRLSLRLDLRMYEENSDQKLASRG
jgi:hypothetical protein